MCPEPRRRSGPWHPSAGGRHARERGAQTTKPEQALPAKMSSLTRLRRCVAGTRRCLYDPYVADTLEELIELQRAVDTAHRRAAELRMAFGPPTVKPWTEAQTTTYETAWRAWRDLDRDMTDAITHYANREALDRSAVEQTVRNQAGNPPDEERPGQ